MDQVWWKNIIKAHTFLERIVMEALEGNSILLSLPVSVPWRTTLIEIVSDRLQIENSKNKLDEIVCPEGDPGAFLLEKYCKNEIRAKYRYGVSYAQFLGKCQETVLNDRYIWVSDITDEKIEQWLDFVSEYSKNVQDKTPGIFILEVHDDLLPRMSKKGIKNLVFNQNISTYDKYAFCALASSETKCKEYVRPYLAEVVALICDEDVELCAVCVAKGMDFLSEPYDTIQEIIAHMFRSDGDCYHFDKSREEVTAVIWETQLKYVFPLVENYRRYFVNQYKEMIKSALPINNGYGEKVIAPEEAEIGTLFYLAGKGTLSIPRKEYVELERYKNARNKLAHMNVLDNEELYTILKYGKRKYREKKDI